MTLFDTADEYSGGLSEHILGEAVKGRRDRVLVATKARTPTGDAPNDAGLSRYHLIRACEASLRRLRTDYIDLYQVHAWDGQTPVEETLDTLDTLVRSGKVRYIGACNHSSWQLVRALMTADQHRSQRYISHQVHYSLQCRDAEYELLPSAIDQSVGVIVWSPLAGGLLTGKYRQGVTPDSPARHLGDWDEPPIKHWGALYALVDSLAEVANAHGTSPSCVALAWLLGREGVTSILLGARTADQLSENLRAAELQLLPDERAMLDQLTAPELIYPYWHQAKLAGDRLSAADYSLLGPHLSDRHQPPTKERK